MPAKAQTPTLIDGLTKEELSKEQVSVGPRIFGYAVIHLLFWTHWMFYKISIDQTSNIKLLTPPAPSFCLITTSAQVEC